MAGIFNSAIFNTNIFNTGGEGGSAPGATGKVKALKRKRSEKIPKGYSLQEWLARKRGVDEAVEAAPQPTIERAPAPWVEATLAARAMDQQPSPRQFDDVELVAPTAKRRKEQEFLIMLAILSRYT